jgi:DNA-binding FrmR family transcriptional regulator
MSTTPALDPDRARLVNRLRRAEGQVRGVQRMIEQGAEPAEVLAQLAAAKAALDRIGMQVISEQLRSCVDDGGADCSDAFADAVETFMRYTTLAR